MLFYNDLNVRPTLLRQVFLHPRQLTPKQITGRTMEQEQAPPLPWGLDSNPVIVSIFTLDRPNLWLTVDEALAVFVEVRSHWKHSGAANPVRHALSYHPMQKSLIRKAVLLALGPFIGKYWSRPGWTHMNDAALWRDWKEDVIQQMCQLSLFMSAVEQLCRMATTKIGIYAQDPWFGDGEKQFLQRLGFTVLEHGEAEALTGSDTFVYAPCMIFKHIMNTIMRCPKHQPAIYITTPFKEIVQASHRMDPAILWTMPGLESRLIAWANDRVFCNAVDVPLDIDHHSVFKTAFDDTDLHVRKTVLTQEELDQPCNDSCKYVPGCCEGRHLEVDE